MTSDTSVVNISGLHRSLRPSHSPIVPSRCLNKRCGTEMCIPPISTKSPQRGVSFLVSKFLCTSEQLGSYSFPVFYKAFTVRQKNFSIGLVAYFPRSDKSVQNESICEFSAEFLYWIIYCLFLRVFYGHSERKSRGPQDFFVRI